MIYVTNTSDYLIKHKSTHVGRIQPRPTLLPTQTRAATNHRRYWRPRTTSSHPGARVRAIGQLRLGALAPLWFGLDASDESVTLLASFSVDR